MDAVERVMAGVLTMIGARGNRAPLDGPQVELQQSSCSLPTQ
jgi:hypothetical protein